MENCDDVMAKVKKVASGYVRGLITPHELISYVFERFADAESVFDDLITAIWQAIPLDLRDTFSASIREAAGPDYRYRRFFLVRYPAPENDLHRDQDHVRAWA